jgi:5-methylcytosine-specific restriction protein A
LNALADLISPGKCIGGHYTAFCLETDVCPSPPLSFILMGKKDITREDVLKAIAEFDQISQEAFLDKYGMKKATSYLLHYNGKTYDSKAILAAAHGFHPGFEPLPWKTFSGGENDAVKYLKKLGFSVPKTRLNWTWDELILACALVCKHDWKVLDESHPDVRELSDLLQMLPIYPVEERPSDFRSAGAVEAKLQNLRTAREDYGKKKSHGSRLDSVVVQAFLDDPEKMQAAAEAIRVGLKSGELQEDYEGLPDIDDPDTDEGTPEGRLLLRKHLYRERNPKKRQEKIDQHKKANNGKLACETCGFDFGAVYGDHGDGYIECHHIVPLSESGETTTRLADLILICSNCHRMIHRRSPWLKPDELRAMITSLNNPV